VRSSQVEAGLRVIKLPVRPRNRVMALFAARRKARMWHGTRSVVEIVLVTRDASRNRDAVIIVDVTVGTLPGRHGVRSSQRKLGL